MIPRRRTISSTKPVTIEGRPATDSFPPASASLSALSTILSRAISPALELCIQYFKAIGIEFTIKPLNRTLLNQRHVANELPMTFWQGDIGSDVVFPLAPRIMHGDTEGNALGWGRAWEASVSRTIPRCGRATAGLGSRLDIDDWTKFHSTLDEAERVKTIRGLFDRFYEDVPCFGTVACHKR